VAAGARPIPGLPGALSFGAAGDVDAVRETMGEIGSSRFGSVAFALPPGISWPLPLYELALLAGTRVNAKGASGVTLTLATCEEQPLALFGARVADAVRTLLTERGVRLRTRSRSFQVERGRLIIDGAGAVPADRVITLSRLVGPALPGLAQDESGFIPTDQHGRVHAAPDVYAAGDVTTFPLKQGGVAAQQANAVCHDIAARVGAPVQPQGFRAVVRGVLLTGAEPMRVGVEADLESPAVRDVDERSGGARGPTDTSSQEPDWHPTKIFGRYLGPYLAREQARSAERSPGGFEREPVGDDRVAEPLEFVLTIAEHDARSGDHALALHMLDAAEAVAGTLPAAFQDRRSAWLDELRRRQ
jgi:sulfide:quinone oxidoreductase